MSPHAASLMFFACRVPSGLVALWSKTLKHLIGPVEAYAALVARKVWHLHVVGRLALYL